MRNRKAAGKSVPRKKPTNGGHQSLEAQRKACVQVIEKAMKSLPLEGLRIIAGALEQIAEA